MIERAKVENESAKKQKITIRRLGESEKGCCCQYDRCKKHKRGDSTYYLTHAVKREGAVVAMCCSRECAEGLRKVIENEWPISVEFNGRSRNGVGPRNGNPPKCSREIIPHGLPPERFSFRPLPKNGRTRIGKM